MVDLFRKTLNLNKYFIVEYDVTSTKDLADAAVQISIGQSVGNPNVRSVWETDELFEDHSCMIMHDRSELEKLKSGTIKIAFPTVNLNWESDGISQFLCMIMGGNLDINTIIKCRVKKVTIPEHIRKNWKSDRVKRIRNFTKVPSNKPLLGGIVKPKTGITPSILLDMVKEMVDNGINFIKEDEILGSPSFCTLEDRIPNIAKYIEDKNIIYCACINSYGNEAVRRAKKIKQSGGNGCHINFWSGWGVYRDIRNHCIDNFFIHLQKSGDRILTQPEHSFGIDWAVICSLTDWMGVDFIHAGMLFGYGKDTDEEMKATLDALKTTQVMPALSCGMHPGLVDKIRSQIGNDWMANVGGALHGHPSGTAAGVRAMRQSIDGNYGKEYYEAIDKWGKLH